MALSDEWFDYHLTPEGWVLGSHKTDFDKIHAETPTTALLTRRYREIYPARYAPAERFYRTDFYDSTQKQIIEELLLKFPHPNDSYSHFTPM